MFGDRFDETLKMLFEKKEKNTEFWFRPGLILVRFKKKRD